MYNSFPYKYQNAAFALAWVAGNNANAIIVINNIPAIDFHKYNPLPILTNNKYYFIFIDLVLNSKKCYHNFPNMSTVVCFLTLLPVIFHKKSAPTLVMYKD